MLFLASGRGEDQRRADAPRVGSLSLELDPEIVMGVVLGLNVFIDERRPVDVVHHEVEPAVVIEVGIGRAVREARRADAPIAWICR